MQRYSIEPRTIKFVSRYGVLSFARKYEKKKSLNRGFGTLKTATKELVYKKREFLGNKITDAVAKSNENKILKQEPVD